MKYAKEIFYPHSTIWTKFQVLNNWLKNIKIKQERSMVLVNGFIMMEQVSGRNVKYVDIHL
jgi:uncharacterized protein YdeI (YjbR/CyaY-like superfamily)